MDSLQNQLHVIILFLATLCAILTFVGLSFFSAGFVRAKNAANTLCKCLLGLSITLLVFTSIGQYIAQGKLAFYISSLHISWIRLIFLATLCALPLPLIVGASAERLKISSFILFSLFFSSLIVPFAMYLVWFSGFLQHIGFVDHGGAGVIYLITGGASLSAVLLLKPRFGKYGPLHLHHPLPASNLPFSTLGVLFFCIGSIGINIGLIITKNHFQHLDIIGLVTLNILLASNTGFFTTATLSRLIYGKTDLTLGLNGLLGGVIAISAAANISNPAYSVLIGLVAGILSYFGIILLDRIKIDDPIGAIATCILSGLWGLAATTFTYFSQAIFMHLGIQLMGGLLLLLFGFLSSFILFTLLKMIIGLRVTVSEEQKGLDIAENGLTAYPEFDAVRKR